MSRADKVAEEIKKEVSNIIMHEINDPRIGFVTITGVDLKPDLRFAKIYYSIIGSPREIESVHAGIKSATGFVRKLIGQRIPLRYTPEIVFEYDNSAIYSQHISEVIERIHKEKEGGK